MDKIYISPPHNIPVVDNYSYQMETFQTNLLQQYNEIKNFKSTIPQLLIPINKNLINDINLYFIYHWLKELNYSDSEILDLHNIFYEKVDFYLTTFNIDYNEFDYISIKEISIMDFLEVYINLKHFNFNESFTFKTYFCNFEIVNLKQEKADFFEKLNKFDDEDSGEVLEKEDEEL